MSNLFKVAFQAAFLWRVWTLAGGHLQELAVWLLGAFCLALTIQLVEAK